MVHLLTLMFYSILLLLAVVGFADVVLGLVRFLLALPEDLSGESKLKLQLRDPASAEMQLRSLLSKIRSGLFKGSVEVVAEDEESFLIACKILRKYPNICLSYQGDLNYNI